MLKYVWAFPATAVGLVLALFARTAGASAVVVDGVIEVAGGRFGKLVSALPHPLRFSAITVGHVVLGIDHSVLQGCRAHEQVHVRQYERWGVFFFPLYLGSSLFEAVRGRSPYWDNHFERQAREEAARAPS
ncbi:MAG TPA: signal peptide prediction [Burkholderiales bacterium]|jgi:hypothetical protein|nr:signal peptide prediction [Burkholderiales bacterium]